MARWNEWCETQRSRGGVPQTDTSALSCYFQQQAADTQQHSTGHTLVEASRIQVAALVVGIHAGNELAALHLQVNRACGAQPEIAGL